MECLRYLLFIEKNLLLLLNAELRIFEVGSSVFLQPVFLQDNQETYFIKTTSFNIKQFNKTNSVHIFL